MVILVGGRFLMSEIQGYLAERQFHGRCARFYLRISIDPVAPAGGATPKVNGASKVDGAAGEAAGGGGYAETRGGCMAGKQGQVDPQLPD